MPFQTIFLTLEQVLVIHEDQIDRYGGSSGLRDLTLLESAIFRPQSSFGGKDLYSTIFIKAAALMHSITLNHPFIDGNKRTGMVTALIFLELNNCKLKVTQDALVETAVKISMKKWNLEQAAEWLEKNCIEV